jgi:Tfp pilus assembly protein PilN
MGIMALAVCVVLAAISFYAQWQVKSLSVQIAELRNSLSVAELRLRELKLRQPKRQSDPALAAQIEAVKTETMRAMRLAAALTEGAFGNTHGLSEFLVALARQHVEGTALTRIELAAGGNAIGIGGVAQAPALVPEYLDRLRREAVFNGRVFSQLSLARGDAGIDFTLTTAGTSFSRKEGDNARH